MLSLRKSQKGPHAAHELHTRRDHPLERPPYPPTNAAAADHVTAASFACPAVEG